MTLGLLAGVVGCLAKPCRPEQWSHVLAADTEHVALVERQTLPPPEAAPVCVPGFADGFVAATA
jgi:hypothetical protein